MRKRDELPWADQCEMNWLIVKALRKPSSSFHLQSLTHKRPFQNEIWQTNINKMS